MSARRQRVLSGVAAVAAAVVLFGGRQPLDACGPFFERAVFTTMRHPDFPLSGFAAGTLGIVEPTYARSYLVMAYRYITGLPLTSNDAKAVVDLWLDRMQLATAPDPPDPVKGWLHDRNRTLPAEAISKLETIRPAGQYDYFDNCLPDAFRQASRTLDRLARTLGPSDPSTAVWIRGQDAVFFQCSGPGAFPAPLAVAGSEVGFAERTYQIAAAHFYAGDFDDAAARFRQIAADKTSRWHTIAPYLVARALIRKGTLTAGEGKVDRAALTDAEAQLRAVIADPAQQEYHRAANALLGFVRFRVDPLARTRELGAQLSAAQPSDQWPMATSMNDYTRLLDKANDGPFSRFNAIPAALLGDTLTDWVLTFQTLDRDAFEHAWTRWQSTSSLPWLLAAIAKVPASDPRARSLRDAAAQVPPGSPAFVMAAFHAARLAADAGDDARARPDADQLLKLPDAVLTGSGRNQVLALRMRVAATFEEWLTFAVRRPVISTYDLTSPELPETDPQNSRFLKLTDRRMFDDDVTAAFNDALPLTRWIEAANSGVLPARLRKDLALAGWARAALLGDEASALQLAPVAARLAPDVGADLTAYVRSQSGAPRQLSAVTTMLRFPGTRPILIAGLEREAALGRIDSYRDNWWCALPAKATGDAPAFLPAAERQAAETAHSRLAAIATAPDYLGTEAVRLARLLPTDPRTPEVLHLAVRATRYGCTDDGTGRVSKAAFDLLHQKYPSSEWAKKTPFWFER